MPTLACTVPTGSRLQERTATDSPETITLIGVPFERFSFRNQAPQDFVCIFHDAGHNGITNCWIGKKSKIEYVFETRGGQRGKANVQALEKTNTRRDPEDVADWSRKQRAKQNNAAIDDKDTYADIFRYIHI